MKRRDFLKYSGYGLAGILVGCSGGGNGGSNGGNGGDTGGGDTGGDDGGGGSGGDNGAVTPDKIFNVTMAAALFEMVDGQNVFMWSFTDPQGVPRMPGPVLEVTQGEVIRVNVTNALTENHAFAIPGVVESSDIAPGTTVAVTFTAPAAGTYLYLDPLKAPVNRVLGLHGPLVVLPKLGNTPYSTPTPAVQQLFDDLGTTAHFPKHALSPAGWQHERTRIWLMHQIDPAFNVRVQNGETISPAEMRSSFLPRYFTLNGRSGVFASHDPISTLEGRIGQPMLVRILNAGLFTHSLHLHANHFYLTAVNNAVQDNVFDIDSIHLFPEDRLDWLVPFVRPPDIPGNQATPLRDLIPEELALVIDDVPQSPLGYPMHCHMEPSQTAAGGNYPQGIVAHVDFLGDLDGIDYPH